MQRLKSIQALRAIAASLVFLCHLVPIEQRLSGRAEPLTDFWLAGAFGVDLFFVISGFVIVWVAADSPPGGKSAVGFLFARVTRIYPTWWLMCGLMMLGFFMLHGVPWNPVRVLEQDLNGPSHVIRSLLLWPQEYHPVLGPGWTLVHELYFYLGFGLFVAALPPRLRLHGVLVWGVLVAIGALLGLSSDFGRTAIGVVFYPPIRFRRPRRVRHPGRVAALRMAIGDYWRCPFSTRLSLKPRDFQPSTGRASAMVAHILVWTPGSFAHLRSGRAGTARRDRSAHTQTARDPRRLELLALSVSFSDHHPRGASDPLADGRSVRPVDRGFLHQRSDCHADRLGVHLLRV